jgi:hypothetical protein
MSLGKAPSGTGGASRGRISRRRRDDSVEESKEGTLGPLLVPVRTWRKNTALAPPRNPSARVLVVPLAFEGWASGYKVVLDIVRYVILN